MNDQPVLPGTGSTSERAGTMRGMVRARWVGIVLAAGQLAAFDSTGLDRRALGGMYVLLAALSGVNALLHRLPDRTLGRRPVVLTAVAFDTVLLLVFVAALAFDPSSSTYVLLVLIPMEAALYFGLRGALVGWGTAVVGLVLREIAETPFGDPFELTSITFRALVVLVVAYAVGAVVAERDHQRRRTEQALARITRGDLWRQRLIAALAHDVRAPLAGARESLTTVDHHLERLTTDDARTVLRAGVRQVDRGLLLARDLLDMAASESAELVLRRTDVPLHELVATTVALSGGAQVEVAVPGDLVVSADRARLEQVVHNLVSNAATHGRSPIEVAAARTDTGIELSVRDHGDGVTDPERLFSAFGGSGRTDSVGLGLWLVRSLVEAHGGTVRHERATPGARFVVALPDPRALHTPSRGTTITAGAADDRAHALDRPG